MKRILIVEDEINTSRALTELLGIWGYEVSGPVQSAKEAIEKANTERPDAVLMDIRLLGGMNGIDAGNIISHQPGIPVIIMTAYFDNNDERLKGNKRLRFIGKPFDLDELRSKLEQCLSEQ